MKKIVLNQIKECRQALTRMEEYFNHRPESLDLFARHVSAELGRILLLLAKLEDKAPGPFYEAGPQTPSSQAQPEPVAN